MEMLLRGRPCKAQVLWVQASRRDLLSLPEMVRDRFATALDVVQFGGKDPVAKPWKGLGPGVFELAIRNRGNAYRLVYAVSFPRVVYVLHAFQKRSPSGRKTSRLDAQMVRRRFAVARDNYEVRYGKQKE
jgi:phage-related protein